MGKKYRLLIAGAFIVIVAAAAFIGSHNIAVFNPKGIIASRERRLMIIAIILGLLVVVPVYVITVIIALKYREGNTKKRKYNPDWDHHRGLELTWWGIPTAIIVFLAVLTWTSSHALDPYKPISSSAKPLTIQVVALDWKWLFIYPKQNIASVNYLQIPVNTPVTFDITSDAPMNSFWIPQLGGQIYAMPGMSTQLHLMASQPGSYAGSSANISGNGFAGMTFTAKAVAPADFSHWVAQVKKSSGNLSFSEYAKLVKPSQNIPPTYYASAASGLYDYTVAKYNEPAGLLGTPGSQTGYQLPAGHTGGHE